MAFLALAVFAALTVLMYVECLLRRWLRALALLTWACLVALGYVLVFNAWTKAACAWEQVTGLWTPCRLHPQELPSPWLVGMPQALPAPRLAVCLGWPQAGFVPVSSLH